MISDYQVIHEGREHELAHYESIDCCLIEIAECFAGWVDQEIIVAMGKAQNEGELCQDDNEDLIGKLFNKDQGCAEDCSSDHDQGEEKEG